MANFEKTTAALLAIRIRDARTMADFFRSQASQQEISPVDRQEYEDLWYKHLDRMNCSVDIGKTLFEIKTVDSEPTWSQVLRELYLIAGVSGE